MKGVRYKVYTTVCVCYLFRCGEVGAVRASAMFGRGAAGDLVGVWKRTPLNFCKHTFLIQVGLEEACVTVKLHQVKDLLRKKRRVALLNKLLTKLARILILVQRNHIFCFSLAGKAALANRWGHQHFMLGPAS